MRKFSRSDWLGTERYTCWAPSSTSGSDELAHSERGRLMPGR